MLPLAIVKITDCITHHGNSLVNTIGVIIAIYLGQEGSIIFEILKFITKKSCVFACSLRRYA